MIFILGLFTISWSTRTASGGKAVEMCKEYGEFVFAEEAAPVLLPGAKVDKTSQCGIVEVPLIVGGEKAGTKEFPHMVALGYGGAKADGAKWMCGGSLVSERFVLTAAHCLRSRDLGEVKWARTGGTNLDDAGDDPGNPQVFSVAERKVHPDYSPPANYHDIALIRLDRDAAFDAYTRPACLNTEAELRVKTAIATGYGRLGYETDQTSRDLLKVNLHLVASAACNESFKFDVNGKSLPRGIAGSQMCAGESAGGKDTCQGDSGGPLQTVLEEPYCMYSLIGVTSFGKFCGMANSPAVYSRVSHYVPWIESVVWP
ncbi:hypothetical protein R5R35_004710 [Gryllus longicercus]|uniref:Peptidase S1 domain-containing protein n=1 Tax=Gryllus longicercus TaxID=2509291 RepID=A0AAN9VQ18_9ORTH